jgi:hypothetical protein
MRRWGTTPTAQFVSGAQNAVKVKSWTRFTRTKQPEELDARIVATGTQYTTAKRFLLSDCSYVSSTC